MALMISRTQSFGSGHFYHNNNYLDQINNNNGLGLFYYNNNNYMMIEKRQVFLRSYQFSRKKSLTERIKRSLVRVERVIRLRLKSARIRLRRLTCFRLRCGLSHRRRRFVRLINHKCNNYNSYCLW